MSERLIINNENQKHIQAYIDYKNIVGDDDGGVLMSDKEFEAYKKKVMESRKNHLYVYWVNLKGYDCKAIGPESMCFCGHRFKSHNFDNVKTKKVSCKSPKCKCPLFDYIPVYGSNDVKCLCKHSYSLHDVNSKKCSKDKCKCVKFGSKFTCNCTNTYDEHMTMIENREERLAQGKSVDPGWMGNNMIAGVGGLNSFTGMINDVYQLEYNALLNPPENKQMLMGENSNNINKKMITNGNNTSGIMIKKNSPNINSEISALELFNKPHIFSNSGILTSKFNRLKLSDR